MANEPPVAASSAALADAVSKMNVLVVEPDILSARILKTKLESWDFNVHVEAAANVAREWLAAQPYRVLIANMEDPKAGGISLCRWLRSAPYPNYTYIIGFGTRLTKEHLVAALDAGADDYLFKPFHVPELRMRMHRARRILVLDDSLILGGGTDPATGVLNRSAFEQFLNVILAQTSRLGMKGALMFVRIENLRDIFRKHGHRAMHGVVVELALRMRTLHRSSDLLAKTRDDEYCLLLQNTHWDLCRPVAERLADALAGLVDDGGGRAVRPVLSIGVVDFPQGSEATATHYLDPANRIHFQTIGGDGDSTNTEPNLIV